MKRPRHEIEAEVPKKGPALDSLPQIRRQVERLCEQLAISYDDLLELQIVEGAVAATLYSRNDQGELYRDEVGRIAIRRVRIPVDTTTFKGDEKDN